MIPATDSCRCANSTRRVPVVRNEVFAELVSPEPEPRQSHKSVGQVCKAAVLICRKFLASNRSCGRTDLPAASVFHDRDGR
jgi:hypothetical protein